MSKSQGPAGDYINTKISPALGTAALNHTEEEDLRREVVEPATELAEAQRQLHCKTNVLPTAMSHGGTPTIKQLDAMVKIQTSQPIQGKSTEPPQGTMTDTTALADAWAKMEAAQPLFLASTVSALHRNAHIWNASHPLLVTYYC